MANHGLHANAHVPVVADTLELFSQIPWKGFAVVETVERSCLEFRPDVLVALLPHLGEDKAFLQKPGGRIDKPFPVGVIKGSQYLGGGGDSTGQEQSENEGQHSADLHGSPSTG
jgi:hypothetical protein